MPTEDAYCAEHPILSHFRTCIWYHLIQGFPKLVMFPGFEFRTSVSTPLLVQQSCICECHCWWTSESPRTHVAKFYGRLRLIRSVWRASNFCVLKLTQIVILWVYYTIHFGFSLFWHFWGINFQLLELLSLAKNHWRGFSTRNAHMVHIVNLIRLKMVYTS